MNLNCSFILYILKSESVFLAFCIYPVSPKEYKVIMTLSKLAKSTPIEFKGKVLFLKVT